MTRDDISAAVTRPFEGGYGGYVVRFKPQPTPDGRFLALAIISCGLDARHTLAAVSPDLPSFATQAAAASAGWEAATRWVDRNALRDIAVAAARTAADRSFARSALGAGYDDELAKRF